MGLRKRFPLFPTRRSRLQAFLAGAQPKTRKLALDAVSFSVNPGEALGVIGENGAGKSTLLRIIAGVITPDEGALRVTNPVTGILELGLGFLPDLTGKENVFLYGSLLGLPKEYIQAHLDRILAFADLGEFADQPLRTYSSGMAARLAFAVVTEVEPAVLVVDEALAVGDGAFQKKCIDRMIRFKAEGRAVLFCSHSLYLVSNFCERTLWLHEGKVQALGPTPEVLDAYQEHLTQKVKREISTRREAEELGPTPTIESLTIPDLSRPRHPGEGLEVEVKVHAPLPRPYHVGIAVDGLDGTSLFSASTKFDDAPGFPASSSLKVRCTFPSVPLAAGRYLVSAFVLDESGLVVYDQVRMPEKLVVHTALWQPSLLFLPHSWAVETG